MAAIHFEGGQTKWAINNTIVSVVSGLHDSSTVTGARFYNNIVSGITHANGYALFTETTTLTDGDYNLFNNAAGYLIRWGAGGTRYSTLAAFRSATGKEMNSLEGDPRFVNASGGNYTLVASSPAVNVGTTPSAYQRFLDLYGIDIRKDIAGTPRPQGIRWDMGAYEYPGSGSQPAPMSPSGIMVR